MLRRYIFRVDPELIDALSGCLFSVGALGLEERPTALVAYAEEELGRELALAYQTFREQVARAFPESEALPLQIEDVDQEFDRAWLEALEPVRLTDEVWFCPTTKRPPSESASAVLWFEPRVAFGSGEHPTTRLAARALVEEQKQIETDSLDRLLDVGTGSGVLGLLALWLGWQRVVGTDISPEALEAARVNASLNDFQTRFELASGSFPADERFFWIVANIDRGTLLELSAELARRLLPGGVLFVTGLLVEDMPEVFEAYENEGLAAVASSIEGEWALLSFRKSPS
jgi:ribosomal protein L11 methyltransferase